MEADLNREKPDVDVVPGEAAQHPHLTTLDVQAEVVNLGWEMDTSCIDQQTVGLPIASSKV